MQHYAFKMFCGLIVALTLLSACSSVPPASVIQPPTLPYSALLAAADAAVPTLDEIFTLSKEQQAEFLAYYNSPAQQHIGGHRRIFAFLANHMAGFDYQGKNYTASESYRLKSGNCISLAVLTKALADLAGVDAEFQSIISAPVYSIENDVMLSSDHVRTFLYDPDFVAEENKIYFAKPAVVIDYLPAAGDLTGPRITQQTFIAMFYRNLAADAVLSGHPEHALALLRTALHYAPTYGAIINLAGVVHRRMDQLQLAEQFYQYGLEVADNKITLTSNYAMLKQGSGDLAAAQQLFQSLGMSDEYDPYLWYLLGKTASQKQQYSLAVHYYKKAVEQAPYMHQLQFELAVAYFQNDQLARARRTLALAAQLAPQPAEQRRYHVKLEALKARR